MTTSKVGIDLIKSFESCRLAAYQDSVGVWTIGYGHTSGVAQGQTISQAKADSLLQEDLKKFEKKVDKYSKYNWNQCEYDALVSFAFNIGSIDQLTANGTRSKQEIADKILAYNKAGGKELAGLTRRRKAERDLFISGTPDKKGEYSFAKDGNKSISKNFKVKEFRCKDGSDFILVDVDFVQNKLQNIRDHFGKPVTINSAYRTETYNKKVGGAKASYHVKGRAFDIVITGVPLNEICKYAESIGVMGIIRYNSFVHLDSREKKYYATNNNGTVKPVQHW